MKINNHLMLRRVPLALVAMLSLGACSDMNRQERGTATGAVIGGATGAVMGGGAAGTAAGAVIGGAIGHEATERK